jgi:hypothetical protein
MTSGGPPPPGPDGSDVVETQVERTELAWARTALASAGLGAIALHLVVRDLGWWPGLAIGAVTAMPGLVAAWWRIRDLRTTPVPRPPRLEGVAMLTGTVALAELLALVLVLS